MRDPTLDQSFLDLPDALDDARLRNYSHEPQVLMAASGRQRKIISRFEGGPGVNQMPRSLNGLAWQIRG